MSAEWKATRTITGKPVRYERPATIGDQPITLVVSDILGCWNWVALGVTQRQSETMPMPHNRVYAPYELASAQSAAETWLTSQNGVVP